MYPPNAFTDPNYSPYGMTNVPEGYLPTEYDEKGKITGYTNEYGQNLRADEVTLQMSVAPEDVVKIAGEPVLKGSDKDVSILGTKYSTIEEREAWEKSVKQKFNDGTYKNKQDYLEGEFGDVVTQVPFETALKDLSYAMQVGEKENTETKFNYDKKQQDDIKDVYLFLSNKYINTEYDNYESQKAQLEEFANLLIDVNSEAVVQVGLNEKAQEYYDTNIVTIDAQINDFVSNNAAAYEYSDETGALVPKLDPEDYASYQNLLAKREKLVGDFESTYLMPLEEQDKKRQEAFEVLKQKYPEKWSEYEKLTPEEQATFFTNEAKELADTTNNKFSTIRNYTEEGLEKIDMLDDVTKKRIEARKFDEEVEWSWANAPAKALNQVNRFGLFIADIGASIGDALITGPAREWKEDKQEDLLQWAQENPEKARELSIELEQGGALKDVVTSGKAMAEFELWRAKKATRSLGDAADYATGIGPGAYTKYVGKNIVDWEDPLQGERGEGFFGFVEEVNWKGVEGVVDTALLATGVGAFGTAAKSAVLKTGVALAKPVIFAAGGAKLGTEIPKYFGDDESVSLVTSDRTLARGAMQRGMAFEQGAIQEKGNWLQGFVSEMPMGKAIWGEGDAFEVGVAQYYKDKGYSQADAEKAAKQLRKSRTGGEIGEGVGIIGANVGSELLGRHLFAAKQAATGPIVGTSKNAFVNYAQRFGQGFTEVGKAGFVEGTAIMTARQVKQQKLIDTETTILGGGAVGYLSAGTIGGLMVGGATAPASTGFVGKTAQQGLGAAAKYGTYVTDVAELPGDLIATGLEKVFPSVAAYAGGAGGMHVPTGVVSAVVTQVQDKSLSKHEAMSALMSSGATLQEAQTIYSDAKAGILTPTQIASGVRTEYNTNLMQQVGLFTAPVSLTLTETMPTSPRPTTRTSTYIRADVRPRTDTPTSTTTRADTNVNVNVETGTQTDIPTNIEPNIPTGENLAGGFPGNYAGTLGAAPGISSWVTDNLIADYAGDFQKKSIAFFDEGAGFAQAESGRAGVLGASAIPDYTPGNVENAVRPRYNSGQQYTKQMRQMMPMQQPMMGVQQPMMGMQQMPFRRPQPRISKEDMAYERARNAVNSGFGDVGQTYGGNVMKQPKKVKTAIPSSAEAKVNRMLGR
jgi:hypothetical protein